MYLVLNRTPFFCVVFLGMNSVCICQNSVFASYNFEGSVLLLLLAGRL